MASPDPPLGAVVGETIRYVWLDEDGAECSPVHEKFSAALRFHQTYSYRAKRLEEARARNREMWGDDYNTEPPRHTYPPPESKTGKAPVKLDRRVIRTYSSALTEAQQTVLDAHMKENS